MLLWVANSIEAHAAEPLGKCKAEVLYGPLGSYVADAHDVFLGGDPAKGRCIFAFSF